MMELAGKVAVITGAAGGIGAALARRFAAEGMKVVLADIDEVHLRAIEVELAEGGADVLPVLADISVEADVAELAQRVLDRFGAAHVLCNNAGVAGVGDPWRGPINTWDWVVGINLYGVVHGIRAFLPIMEEQGEGHIVNTASMAGLLAMPGFGPYNATKSAVVAISEGLFIELVAKGSPVRVSALCPGFVRTSLMHDERVASVRWAARLGDQPPASADPVGQAMDAMLRAGVETGIEPDDVAGQVLDAIRAERFWVLTHPAMAQLPVERMQRAAAGINPA
jgi:NAD(P)-dependent dehydrogenase (short-subunit alcohol dehydrogenase family)